MQIKIPDDIYKNIENIISSEASPVGIDAKKTHIIILHKLIEIERRLAKLEGKSVTGWEWSKRSYALKLRNILNDASFTKNGAGAGTWTPDLADMSRSL